MQRGDRRVPRRAVIARHAPERQRAELRGDDDGAAGRERRERRRDQPVHVKQRHHAQRHVVRRELVVPCDVAGGNRQVRVRERHALRTSGAAARVQHERDIVNVGRRDGAPTRDAGERDRARVVQLDAENRHAIAGSATRIVGPVGWKNEHLCRGVFEVEAELVFLVARIQRRGGARHRRGEERHDHRQAVRQRDADAIAAANAGRRQLLRDGVHLIAKRTVGDAQMLFRESNRSRACGRTTDQIHQRKRRGRRRGHERGHQRG